MELTFPEHHILLPDCLYLYLVKLQVPFLIFLVSKPRHASLSPCLSLALRKGIYIAQTQSGSGCPMGKKLPDCLRLVTAPFETGSEGKI
jgi:hypothetical protein